MSCPFSRPDGTVHLGAAFFVGTDAFLGWMIVAINSLVLGLVCSFEPGAIEKASVARVIHCWRRVLLESVGEVTEAQRRIPPRYNDQRPVSTMLFLMGNHSIAFSQFTENKFCKTATWR